MENAIALRLRDFSCGLFFMFQAIGTVVLYCKGRQHRLQRSAFHYMLYLFAISIFEFYVFFIHNFLGTLMTPLTDMLQMSVIPISLMLLYRLTHSHDMPIAATLVNVAPYLVAMTLYVICPATIVYDVILYLALAHIAFVICYGFFAVRRFNQRLMDYFSSDENLSLRWLWLFLLLFVALGVTWLTATISSSPVAATIYNVMCSFILGLLCYFVYRQEDMLEALESTPFDQQVPMETIKTDDSVSDNETNYHFAENVEQAFRERQLHLDPTLNINGLARELGTNRTYISNYLNQQLHTTFYEYVNGWRIERAKELLSASSLPLEQIAEQAGFNSLSTFRRYFIKTVGMTPNEYRKHGQ